MDSRTLTVDRFRTADDLLKIMRHPDVWSGITDDGTRDKVDLQIPRDWMDRCVYACKVGDEYAGFVLFDQRTQVLAEFHGACLPQWRGPVGMRLARMGIARFWQDSGCEKLVAYCPAHNRVAQRANAVLGFVREGLLKDAYRHDGALEDLIVFGMSREGGS